jgi:hypothetical protein
MIVLLVWAEDTISIPLSQLGDRMKLVSIAVTLPFFFRARCMLSTTDAES